MGRWEQGEEEIGSIGCSGVFVPSPKLSPTKSQ